MTIQLSTAACSRGPTFDSELQWWTNPFTETEQSGQVVLGTGYSTRKLAEEISEAYVNGILRGIKSKPTAQP